MFPGMIVPLNADGTLDEPRGAEEVLLGFARMLRVAGVEASPDRVHSLLDAVHSLDILDQDKVYWAGRLTLCANPEDLSKYDAGFAAYFGGDNAKPAPLTAPAPQRMDAAFGVDQDDSDGSAQSPDPPIPGEASGTEILRHKDYADLSNAERSELNRLFELLGPISAMRRTRRFGPSRHGVTDPRRSIRRAIRNDGELIELAKRDRRRRPRRLVILADISGSMAPYADPILRFAHAAIRRNPAYTEAFTLGTRLTRVTRELRLRDPEKALRAAGNAIPDWSGGTQLGEMLRAFLDRWGQRGTARRAIVVIFSDGWERGDPTLLGEQMARLHRLAHEVIWANPHKGHEGYEPLTRGISAALPHIDHFVAGHSFAAYSEIATVIAHA